MLRFCVPKAPAPSGRITWPRIFLGYGVSIALSTANAGQHALLSGTAAPPAALPGGTPSSGSMPHPACPPAAPAAAHTAVWLLPTLHPFFLY